MTTALKSLSQDLRLTAVFEKLLTGEANTISKACELAGVPRSTFYSMVGQGMADQFLAGLQQNIVAEVLGQASAATPSILENIVADCTDEKLTARDRQDARRTFLAFVRHLTGTVREPEPTEDARAWLEGRGKSFSPVQINIHVGKEESPPTIEVEGSEIEE